MSTLLTQIEACLNSRQLQSLSNDPEDIEALTLGPFLIGTPFPAVPEPSSLNAHITKSTYSLAIGAANVRSFLEPVGRGNILRLCIRS